MDMDSTPNPTRTPTRIQESHHLKPSASKLPIKRKTPDPNPPAADCSDPKPPPFKFHRIWTEPDEIRFLQGLLDCSTLNLSFPRDLGVFYSRFSHNMSQPYTKSQLSEKLRRLRKKFRVTSTRLSKGLDLSLLSLHDRELYDLSKRLWHPDYTDTSPFNGARSIGVTNNRSSHDEEGLVERSGLVGVKIDFSPTLEVIPSGFDDDLENAGNDDVDLGLDCVDGDHDRDNKKNDNEDVKLSEVNVEFEGGEAATEDEAMDNLAGGRIREVKLASGHNVECIRENEIRKVAADVVMDVFDECLNDARGRLIGGEKVGIGSENLQVRWRQQRIAEFEAFVNRLRLVLEYSLKKQ